MTQAVFTSSGSWSTPAGVTSVDLLIVGGGGAGGSQATSGTGACGGGGAGQVSWVTGVAVFPGDSVPVVVGTGGVSPTGAWGQGGDGTASSFTTRFGATTAAGGGGGGALTGTGSQRDGRTGASGGGGGGGGSTQNGTAGTGTAGNNGGAGIGNTSSVSSRGGGGGGGAGGAGAAGVTGGSPSSQRIGGAGGVGVDHSAHVGTSVGVAGWFGGGGAGGTGSDQATNVGPGGQGGGGNGALATLTAATAGAANTGGGGGGGGHAIGRAGGNGGSGVVIVVYTAPVAPGAPTSLAAVPGSTAIAFSWAAPVTGDPATGYKVRIDGGTWTDVGLVLTHTFTGLTPSTAHTLEVLAYNAAGDGTPASLGASTAADMPDTAYQADIRIGSHTWTCNYGDTVDPDVPNVLAGAAFTWAAPDNAGWPPPLHTVDRDVLTLRLFSPDAADFGDIRKGDLVRFKFTPAGYTFADPLVDFAGRVRAVKVEDRQTTGAFLQLTAADHTVTLQDWTVPGETLISTAGDTQAEVLERIGEVLDALETAGGRDMVPGGFGDPLPAALDLYYTGTVDGYTIPADQYISAFDLFARYGFNMLPLPAYDDTTGELDPATPFVIAYLDPYNRFTVDTDTDACVVPTESVDWERDFTPNVVEYDGGILWVGETYAAPIPDYPDWRLLRVSDTIDLNTLGIQNEVPETGAWAPFTFTVLGWQGPGTVPETGVAGWLRAPDRYKQYVTLTGIDPTKNPNGDATVSGMLRGCTWSIRDNGRWTIDAGLRPSRGETSTTPAGTWADLDPAWTWDDLDPTWTWDDM